MNNDSFKTISIIVTISKDKNINFDDSKTPYLEQSTAPTTRGGSFGKPVPLKLPQPQRPLLSTQTGNNLGNTTPPLNNNSGNTTNNSTNNRPGDRRPGVVVSPNIAELSNTSNHFLSRPNNLPGRPKTYMSSKSEVDTNSSSCDKVTIQITIN